MTMMVIMSVVIMMIAAAAAMMCFTCCCIWETNCSLSVKSQYTHIFFLGYFYFDIVTLELLLS